MNKNRHNLYLSCDERYISETVVHFIDRYLPQIIRIQEEEKAHLSILIKDKKIFLKSDQDTEATPIKTPLKIIDFLEKIEKKLSKSKAIQIGQYQFDPTARIIRNQSHTCHLTEKETEVLTYLNYHKDKGVTRDDLLNDVWNYADNVDTHTIETHIYRLRQKLLHDLKDNNIIETGDDGYYLSKNS